MLKQRKKQKKKKIKYVLFILSFEYTEEKHLGSISRNSQVNIKQNRSKSKCKQLYKS